jgi:putative addiction module component (TIGR02574 family)
LTAAGQADVFQVKRLLGAKIDTRGRFVTGVPLGSLAKMIQRCSVAHVTSIPKATELSALSVSDRLDLMDEIWTSLTARPERIPLPDWHMAEIKRRLVAFAADGNAGRAAEDVFAELKRSP